MKITPEKPIVAAASGHKSTKEMSGPTPEQLSRNGSEAGHQMALFCWAALHTYRHPELEWLFAIPNGGTRNRVEAGFLKAQGVRRGVPDVMLPIARYGFHGLWIEMKVKDNKPSPDQNNWFNHLKTSGYFVVLCYSWIDAKECILRYLEDGHQEFFHR